METYIRRSQNNVAQYIATRPILDLCKAAERKWGVRVGMRWFEQVVIYLTGSRETAVVAAEAESDKDGME